ncbi:MAG: GspL/Epsl periplasmic domain-containing protein [Tepidisphaeraceae bacterium]|jgi:type II secretory pathway component PulL
MKSSRGAILMAGPGEWRIGAWTTSGVAWTDTGISSHATAAEISEKLPAAMDRAGCRGRPVVLALPSDACLAASIATAALPRKDRRRAMEYRLEGKLPLAIEEVSSDFVVHNGQALGVCVRADFVGSSVATIRQCGVRLEAVCPAAILGFQAGEHGTESPDLIVWQDGAMADVFLLDGGELVQWHWVPATTADVSLIVASHAARRGRDLRVELRGATHDLTREIGRLANVHSATSDATAMHDAALQTARRVVSHESEPLVNFAHDSNGGAELRKPLTALLVASLFLSLAVIGSMIWRAQRYAAVADGFDQQEQALFQQLFPNEAVPVGVHSRLQSYAGDLQPQASAKRSALIALYHFLANLPATVHFQLDEMQFDAGQATVHGRTDSLAHADQIAAALRKSSTLNVDDPQTQQLGDGGVGFTITARERGRP